MQSFSNFHRPIRNVSKNVMWICFACYENASVSKSTSTFYVVITDLFNSQIYLLLVHPTLNSGKIIFFSLALFTVFV